MKDSTHRGTGLDRLETLELGLDKDSVMLQPPSVVPALQLRGQLVAQALPADNSPVDNHNYRKTCKIPCMRKPGLEYFWTEGKVHLA